MSRVFDNFPENRTCPICGESKQGRCVLAGIDGTESGNNIKATPVHLDCLLSNLRHSVDPPFIYVIAEADKGTD